MNRLFKAIAIGVTGCLARFGFAAEAAPAAQVLYPAESRQSFAGPPDWFTGDVKVEVLFPDNDYAHFSGAYVTFQAGARTAWHLHPAGQHMVVTAGTALTGTRDGKVIEFGEGETVWCPPDLDHWHGATPYAAMTHLVITGSRDGENVVWKEKVTDEIYYGDRQARDQAPANIDALTARQQGGNPQPDGARSFFTPDLSIRAKYGAIRLLT